MSFEDSLNELAALARANLRAAVIAMEGLEDCAAQFERLRMFDEVNRIRRVMRRVTSALSETESSSPGPLLRPAPVGGSGKGSGGDAKP